MLYFRKVSRPDQNFWPLLQGLVLNLLLCVFPILNESVGRLREQQLAAFNACQTKRFFDNGTSAEHLGPFLHQPISRDRSENWDD